MANICIIVDRRTPEPLLKCEEGAAGRLPLTTIAAGQNRAQVEIYSIERNSREKLYSLEINDLPAEKPEIDVSGRCGGGILYLGFMLNGREIHHASIRLPDPGKKHTWWPVIPAAMITAALLLLIFPPRVEEPETVVRAPARAPAAAAELPAPEPKLLKAVQALPITETVYFLPNASGLTPDTLTILDRIAGELASRPGWLVIIEGHCALAGTEQGRVDLSQERAGRVFDYLAASGWAPESGPEIHGYGGAFPVTKERALQNLNRRVEISADLPESSE